MIRRSNLPLLGALACVSGLVVVGFLALVLHAGHVRDAAMLHGFTALDRPRVHGVLSATVHLADPLPYALIGLACVAVALARRRGWRALAVPVLLVGTGATTAALKQLLAQPRNEPWLHERIGDASLPSGHATAAMTLALCAVLVAPPTLRAATALVGGAFAIGTGYAVIALAWHFPSDVVAGFLVAGLWTSLAVAALHRLERGAPEPAARPAWELLAGLAGGAALVAAAVAESRDDVTAYALERPTLAVGALAIAALALALVTAISAASSPRAAR